MNANQVYENEYYAYYPSRPKGMTPVGAAKVRCKRLKRSKYTSEKNLRAEAEIVVVEKNGTWLTEGVEKLVPVRDLIDFWDDYKAEEQLLLDERARREYETRQKQVATQVLETLINTRLAEKGLPHGSISITGYNDTVRIPLAALRDWLGIQQDEIDDAVTNAIGPAPAISTFGYSDLPSSDRP